MLSTLLDSEWLLSTLFDASLLTFEPPETAAPFFVLSRFGALSGLPGEHPSSGKAGFAPHLTRGLSAAQSLDLACGKAGRAPGRAGAAATPQGERGRPATMS